MKFTRIFVALQFAALLTIAAPTGSNASTVDAPSGIASNPALYCLSTGGIVQERIPEFGTNNPKPLKLSGVQDFCRYTSKDGSQINLLLSTLTATKPTLAALAYYAKVPLGSGCTGNPASCYCTLLGGSDQFGGANISGGGWVIEGNSANVLETCVFPDMSSIDSWGLAYHSAGIIRGKNLAEVLKYANPYNTTRSFLPHKANGFPY